MNIQLNENLWDAVKTVLTGKFIALNTHLKKKKKQNVIISFHDRQV